MDAQRFACRQPHSSKRRARLLPLVFFCYTLLPACVSSCVKLPRRAGVVSGLTTHGLTPAPPARQATLININTASREELERLPGIGEGLAARIVEHRERHGAFRRAEHLIIVRGISERRFASLRALITAD